MPRPEGRNDYAAAVKTGLARQGFARCQPSDGRRGSNTLKMTFSRLMMPTASQITQTKCVLKPQLTCD